MEDCLLHEDLKNPIQIKMNLKNFFFFIKKKKNFSLRSM